jgi:hypothetical protein
LRSAQPENASDFLTRKGFPPAESYFEAQRSIPRYAHEPWFDELDTLFARALTELALPEITKLPPLIELSRNIRNKELKMTIEGRWLGIDVCGAWISQLTHLVRATQKNLAERSISVGHLRHTFAQTKLKTVAVILECEELLASLLREDLADLRARLEWLRTYAYERGWKLDVSG